MAADAIFTPDFSLFTAELDKIAKKQAVLTNLTATFGKEGAKAYTSLEKAAERAAKGPSAWTLALQANTAAIGDFRGKVNLGAESLGKMGSAIGAVSPQLGVLVQGLQKATGVISAGASGAQLFGGGLTAVAGAAGVVAVAAAPLALLWHDVAEGQDAAADAAKIWNSVQDDSIPLIKRSKAAVAALALELAPLTTAQKKEQQVAASWATQLKAANAGREEQLRIIEAQLKGGEALNEINERRAALGEEELDQVGKTSPKLAALLELRKKLENEIKANTKASTEGLDAERELAKQRQLDIDIDRQLEQAEKDIEEAKRANKEATKDATSVERERAQVQERFLRNLLAEADAEIKRAEALEKSTASLAALLRSSEVALATDRERIQLSAQASREAAVSVANEAQAASDSAEERKRIAQDLSDTLINIKTDEVAKLQKIDEDAAAEALAKAAEDGEKWREGMIKALNTVGSVSEEVFDIINRNHEQNTDKAIDRVDDLQSAYDDAVSDGNRAQAKAIKAQLDTAEEAALSAFDAQKKAATQEAIVQGILGVAKAAASAPPPANVPAIITATATGIGQVVAARAVPPPEFDDTPGAMMARNMQPARPQVSFHPDDIFIAGKTPQSVVSQAADLAGSGRRQRIGPQLGKGTLTLLTTDAERATRGRIRRKR